jgi:hypothetical protein
MANPGMVRSFRETASCFFTLRLTELDEPDLWGSFDFMIDSSYKPYKFIPRPPEIYFH